MQDFYHALLIEIFPPPKHRLGREVKLELQSLYWIADGASTNGSRARS